MQPYSSPPIKLRKAVLIFLKIVGPPLILYVDDPESLYSEIKQLISNASGQNPKLVEKQGKGPLKKLAILDTQIAGVAMQEEPCPA